MLFSISNYSKKIDFFTGEDMETVKIESVIGKMTKTNKAFYQITFDDGRKATCWDAAVRDLGGATVLAEFKQNGDFLNVKVHRVVSRDDRPADVQSGSASSAISSEKPGINPVFVFLGACSMMAPVMLDSLNGGNNIDDTMEIIKKNFGQVYSTIKELYKTNAILEEYVETAEKLDE